MFLNIHPARNNNRLTLENQNLRQKSYLNSLNKINKQKSYSTTSLRQQFQDFKPFKNKSLSHVNSNNVLSLNNSALMKPNKQYRNEPVKFSKIQQTSSNLRAKEFKKSYLNLDTKLNKSAIPKDYFKYNPSTVQTIPQKNKPKYLNSQINPSQQETLLQKIKYRSSNPQNYRHDYNQNNFYKKQVERRLQEEDRKRSIALIDEINAVKQLNQFLKLQNQELRKQRSIDLEIIARQNEVMQKQQELLNSKDQQILRIKQENKDSKHFDDFYTFTDSRNYFDYNQNTHPCRQCKLKVTNKQVQGQFVQLKMEKVEEQKKLMKKEIHELVYQCQKYKQSLKKMDEKYQKQLIQNQKLIRIISQEDFSMSNTHKKNNSSKFNLVEQKSPYLNLNQNRQNFIEHEPVSIKSGNYQSQKQRSHDKMSLNSPKQNSSQKMKSYNSGSSFIRYVEDISQPISDLPCQNKRKRQMNFFEYNKNSNGHGYDEIRKSKLKSTEWCQNQNIKKYLEQINKQKQKQYKQIEKLLKI